MFKYLVVANKYVWLCVMHRSLIYVISFVFSNGKDYKSSLSLENERLFYKLKFVN